MKTVIFNPVAVADLDEITNHIGQFNVSAADEVRDSVLDTAERIGQESGIGIRPSFSTPRFAGIRFIPADAYPKLSHLLPARSGAS